MLEIPGLLTLSISVFVTFLIVVFVLSQRRTITNKQSVAVLALSIGMFVALAIQHYNFIVDDVYISLRYARNLAEGHGLVFNTDNSVPVEGYTNFLWVVMEATFFALKFNEETILHVIRIVGLVFGAGVIIITFRLIRLLTGDLKTSLLGALFLAAIPEFSFWAVGGLETPMYMFWLMLGLYRYLVEKRNHKIHFWSMVLFLLMSLTRPEGLFFVGAIVFVDVVYSIYKRKTDRSDATENLKNTIIGFTAFALLYTGYFLWRYNFYDLPLPNTFYAKKMSSVSFLIHRIIQMSKFIVPLFPFIAIAFLGFFYMNKNVARERLIVVVAMLLLLAFSFAARNEWMPGYRYALPFVPLLIVFFSCGLTKIVANAQKEWGWKWQTRLAAFTLPFLLGVFLLYEVHDLRKTGNNFATNLNRAHVPLGKWLKKYAPQNASYASWDMGAVPFYSNIPHIIDINSEGLLNTYTTFHGYNIDRFLSSNPSFLVLPPDADYVRPAEIRDFYSHKKVRDEYEFLFSIAFRRDYLLNVYKHKNVVLPPKAMEEGKYIAAASMRSLP